MDFFDMVNQISFKWISFSYNNKLLHYYKIQKSWHTKNLWNLSFKIITLTTMRTNGTFSSTVMFQNMIRKIVYIKGFKIVFPFIWLFVFEREREREIKSDESTDCGVHFQQSRATSGNLFDVNVGRSTLTFLLNTAGHTTWGTNTSDLIFSCSPTCWIVILNFVYLICVIWYIAYRLSESYRNHLFR